MPAVATDLILHTGLVWTGDPARPSASALAIEAGRITAVGDDAPILALAGPDTQRIDLQGHRVVPGINDHHVHLGAKPPSTELELQIGRAHSRTPVTNAHHVCTPPLDNNTTHK